MNRPLLRALMLAACLLAVPADAAKVRVMAVGDSITEGGASFANWRYPLWEKLYTAGYRIEYVGSRKSPSRIGELRHEGYGGKNSAFLAATVPVNFRKHPADVVLLHAGHNQFADQHPVPGVVRDTRAMIEAFRAVNPRVAVLLAQPIPSAKLPKYAYMPELHAALAELAGQLDRPDSRVILVPQGEGFDPVADTVADRVHPNASGAAKMTRRWFEAMVKVLDRPEISYQPEMLPYKSTGKGDLLLHVFRPNDGSAGDRPVIVFFFGGGWQHGTPLQFYPECAWFAERGFVAISADYRTAFTHGTYAFEAVEDGKSAVRWIRREAARLGVDPKRIVAAGASAGGQVAAATALVPGLDGAGEDPTVSCRPDALLLWYPVIDNGPDGYGDGRVKSRWREISPLHNVRPGAPPAFIFIGSKDPLVPVATIREFERRMKEHGTPCGIRVIEGAGHPVYSYRDGPNPLRGELLETGLAFLRENGIVR